MKIEIKTKDVKKRQILQLYQPFIVRMFHEAENEFNFKPPKLITLRHVHQMPCLYTQSSGIAGFNLDIGHWIALNLKFFNGVMYDRLMYIMAEEVAHIVTDIITGKMYHNDFLKEVRTAILRRME